VHREILRFEGENRGVEGVAGVIRDREEFG